MLTIPRTQRLSPSIVPPSLTLNTEWWYLSLLGPSLSLQDPWVGPSLGHKFCQGIAHSNLPLAFRALLTSISYQHHQHMPPFVMDSLKIYSHINHTGTTKELMESVRGFPIRVSLSSHKIQRSWLNMKINSQWIKGWNNPKDTRMDLPHIHPPPTEIWPPFFFFKIF